MKRITYSLFIAVCFMTTANGQTNHAPFKYASTYTIPQNVTKENLLRSTKSISATTALMIRDIKNMDDPAAPQKLTPQALTEKYGLITKAGKLYANAILTTVSEDFDIAELSGLGVISGMDRGDFQTALIPIHQISNVANHSAIKNVHIGMKGTLTVEQARVVTNVNQVQTGAGLNRAYLGGNVVVGIIDVGFDYTHPNFFDNTGNFTGYKIKRVWEQKATSGTPPAGYTYGRELTSESSIRAAMGDEANQSHGTHVAGTAAGTGSIFPSFRGIAPAADLVLVSTPITEVAILEGIEYIQNYASSVGRPCVINMSLGSTIGPRDGQSFFDQICDTYFTGPGKILVGAAGNNGGNKMHVSHTLSSASPFFYTFTAFQNGLLPDADGSGVIDAWGDIGSNFSVKFLIADMNTGSIVGSSQAYSANTTGAFNETIYDNDGSAQDPCHLAISTGIDPNNNKPRILVEIDNSLQDNNHQKVLVEVQGNNGTVHMWGTNLNFANHGESAPIKDGDDNITITEFGGTGNSVITVGAYTSRDSWTDMAGTQHGLDFPGAVGDIASFSSRGPATDGRSKPDITAPGNSIASSVSSFDNNYTSAGSKTVNALSDGTNNWFFGEMSGTSMASPIVTGIIALWLEANPNLTTAQVKNTLNSTSITDAYTGNIPAAGSNTWGKGKINALAGILTDVSGIKKEDGVAIYPNPTSEYLNLRFDQSYNDLSYTLSDITGKTMQTHTFNGIRPGEVKTITVGHLPAGMYYVKFHNDNTNYTIKLTLIK